MKARQKLPGDVCHDAFLAAVNDPVKSPAQCWEDVYAAAVAIPLPTAMSDPPSPSAAMKTPGQINFEATNPHGSWDHATQYVWEAAAQAVLASQWRKSDSEEPETTVMKVLSTDGQHVCVTRFCNRPSDSTHWAPIPPLPTPPEPTLGLY